MSGKAAEKNAWTLDETQSALQHDGLSRIYTLLGLSHLSTHHSTCFTDILAGYAIQRARGLLDKGTTVSNTDAIRSSSDIDALFDTLPNWYEIHNKRCTNCGNALFLGINCATSSSSSSKVIGVKCRVCEMIIVREEPNVKVKREYRSIKCRQRRELLQVEMQKKDKVDKLGKKAKRELDEVESPIVEKKVQTLEQRAADLRKKTKEKKKEKLIEAKKEENEVMSVSIKVIPPAVEKKSSPPLIQASQQKKRKEVPTPGKQSEALRLMLTQKRAKQEKENPSEARCGGLQDFLGSL